MEIPVPSSFITVVSRCGYNDGEIGDVLYDAMPHDDDGADVQHARYCIEDRRCTEESTRDAANVVVTSLQQGTQFDRALQMQLTNESQNTSVHAAALVAFNALTNGERQTQLHALHGNLNDILNQAAREQNRVYPNDLTIDGPAAAVAELTFYPTLMNSANGRRVVFTLSEQQLQELIECGEAYVTPSAMNSVTSVSVTSVPTHTEH